MPITLDTLIATNPPLTAEQSIIGSIRQGVYPWVAAETVGIPRKQLSAWMKSKAPRYRRFAEAVRKARAWARMVAEFAMFKNDPRTWLRAGPGRESRSEPGWSKEVLAQLDQDEIAVTQPLADPVWRAFFSKLLETLAPFPEARAALAAMLQAEREREKTKNEE